MISIDWFYILINSILFSVMTYIRTKEFYVRVLYIYNANACNGELVSHRYSIREVVSTKSITRDIYIYNIISEMQYSSV